MTTTPTNEEVLQAVLNLDDYFFSGTMDIDALKEFARRSLAELHPEWPPQIVTQEGLTLPQVIAFQKVQRRFPKIPERERIIEEPVEAIPLWHAGLTSHQSCTTAPRKHPSLSRNDFTLYNRGPSGGRTQREDNLNHFVRMRDEDEYRYMYKQPVHKLIRFTFDDHGHVE